MPRPKKLEEIIAPAREAYKTWANEAEKAEVIRGYGEAITKNEYAVARTRDFSNLLPGISSKPGLTREDFDYYREDSIVPKKPKQIIVQSEVIYQTTGIIHNILDSMSSFSTQGIKLSYSSPGKEKVIQDWQKKVNFNMVSERLASCLLRHGIAYVLTYSGKLKNEEFFKSYAIESGSLPAPIKVGKKEIPYKYVFLNPTMVEPLGGPLAAFSDTPQYGIRMPHEMAQLINSPQTDEEKSIVAKLPQSLRDAAKTFGVVPIDSDRLTVLNYKKDDWATQAVPFIFPCLDDAKIYKKLKLADLTVIDSLMSKVRVWRFGNIEKLIMPTPEAFATFASILENNTGAGLTEICWGPDIDFIETESNAYQFLGEDKYKPTINAIYSALGIGSLSAGGNGDAKASSIKGFIENLQYLRNIVVDFWEKQCQFLAKGMNLRQKIEIEFDLPILVDDNTFKVLLKDLCDRNIVSEEFVRRNIGASNRMETIRLSREQKARDKKKRIAKAGPWHKPDPENDLKKIALQGGQATPSEVGLELEKNKAGQKKMMDVQLEMKAAQQAKKNPGQPGQGRPKTSYDKVKRKTPNRTKANLYFWAKDAQAKLNEILNPIVLAFYEKKNVRSLTAEQAAILENTKFSVLCNTVPFSEITEESVAALMNNNLSAEYAGMLRDSVASFSAQFKRAPTVEELREFQRIIISELHNEGI